MPKQQRKDGKEAKFMNFSKERHELCTLLWWNWQNSDQGHEEGTGGRILCPSKQIPSTWKVLNFKSFTLFCYFNDTALQNKFLR